MATILVRTQEDIDQYLRLVRKAAADARAWIAKQTGDPLVMLRQMKFDEVGYHPIDGHPLNLVEQINQTWTYLVALAAAKQLLALHPEAGGFRLTGSVCFRAARYYERSRRLGRC